ncbi:MAG TPA: response regulator [Bryobacteraceae bacterium]|jgi:signal transduction histidine kinase|nr:response regulator [Bryobacteraceae bacterium]
MVPETDLPDKPRILVLEDEAITADHLRRILLRLGYEIVGVTGDGTVALDLLAKTRPDLLLADIGLEGEVDGIEVANRAREQWKTPTIFLTAYSDATTMQRAKVTEPYGFLVKPFAEQELHATIEIALQQRAIAASHVRQVQAAAEILGRTQEELNAITGRLFDAEEQERQRIARDLHDDVGQRLALLQIDLERLWTKLPVTVQMETDAERATALARIAEIAKDLRDLSHHLHPQVLDDLGLETALRQLCESFEERHSTPVRFSTRNAGSQVSPSVAIAIYRIVQEALQNVAKHAVAESVDIALVGGKTRVELSIRDNGIGFDPVALKRGTGLGLISMAQRAKLASGDFEIQSRPNAGTQIHVSVPREPARSEITDFAPAHVLR